MEQVGTLLGQIRRTSPSTDDKAVPDASQVHGRQPAEYQQIKKEADDLAKTAVALAT